MTAFLSAEALGPENVVAVRMPYRTSNPDSLAHAQLVIDHVTGPDLCAAIGDLALREALAALLGGIDGLWAAAVRAAILLGESGQERARQLDRLGALARGETAGPAAAEAVRKALVEALAHGDRAQLIGSLDEALLGVRPRPAGYFAALAS